VRFRSVCLENFRPKRLGQSCTMYFELECRSEHFMSIFFIFDFPRFEKKTLNQPIKQSINQSKQKESVREAFFLLISDLATLPPLLLCLLNPVRFLRLIKSFNRSNGTWFVFQNCENQFVLFFFLFFLLNFISTFALLCVLTFLHHFFWSV
jgi:hypothetical protein